jgi:hypothetical protein
VSKVKSTCDGFVALDGVPVLLSPGDEYESDHPLVKARPDLFDAPPEPKRPVLGRKKDADG